MSQQLSLEISDEVYANLENNASAAGVSVDEWVLPVLSRVEDSGPSMLSSECEEEARIRFRNHDGAVSLGYATGLDNDQIDVDLAKAYADDY